MHTKPKGATIFRETKFGILSRREIVELEAQGIQRGLKFIMLLAKKHDYITARIVEKRIVINDSVSLCV